MSEAKRLCPECKRPVFGRTDKKFCSDSCRNTHNNRINSERSTVVRNVNNILGRNRRILLELNPKGKSTIHRDDLLRKGFDFEFYTSSYTTKAGKMYYFCYDQGYLQLNDNRFLLVEK